MTSHASTTKGHCLCGAIEYEFSGRPLWISHCHCETCRRHTSSAVATFVGVKIDQFSYLKGTPASYQSSPDVWRYFCPTCGSPMAYTSDKKHPGEVHLYIGTLEHPEQFAAKGHVHAGEQLPWFEVEDELPRYERASKGHEPVRKGPKKKASGRPDGSPSPHRPPSSKLTRAKRLAISYASGFQPGGQPCRR